MLMDPGFPRFLHKTHNDSAQPGFEFVLPIRAHSRRRIMSFYVIGYRLLNWSAS